MISDCSANCRWCLAPRPAAAKFRSCSSALA